MAVRQEKLNMAWLTLLLACLQRKCLWFGLTAYRKTVLTEGCGRDGCGARKRHVANYVTGVAEAQKC